MHTDMNAVGLGGTILVTILLYLLPIALLGWFIWIVSRIGGALSRIANRLDSIEQTIRESRSA